jgi:O-antigen ligase
MNARARTALRYLTLAAPIAGLGVALIGRGANDAALAALLSCGLLTILVGAIALCSREKLRTISARHALSLAAALLLTAWTLITTWRFPGSDAPPLLRPLLHPLWDQLTDGAYTAVSIAPYRALEGVASLLGAIAAFALGALIIADQYDHKRIRRLICVLALALSTIALVLHFAPDAASPRLQLNFGSPNSAATLFGILCLLMIASILDAGRRMRRSTTTASADADSGAWDARSGASGAFNAPVNIVVLVLCLCCLLLTASRAGIAATLASAVLLLAIAGWSRRGRGALTPMLAMLALLIGVVLFWGLSFAADRLVMTEADSETRTLIVEAHWHAFMQRPWIGHGMNSFHTLNALVADQHNWPALRGVGAAHNIYLQALEEIGVIGVAAFAAMLAGPLWNTLRHALSRRRGQAWAAGVFCAFILVFVHGWVDFGLQTPAIAALLCFLLGAADQRASEARDSDARSAEALA